MNIAISELEKTTKQNIIRYSQNMLNMMDSDAMSDLYTRRCCSLKYDIELTIDVLTPLIVSQSLTLDETNIGGKFLKVKIDYFSFENKNEKDGNLVDCFNSGTSDILLRSIISEENNKVAGKRILSLVDIGMRPCE